MNNLRLIYTISALTLLAQACVTPPEVTPDEAERAVLNWLSCDECWNRELEHVVVLGDEQVGEILRRYAENPVTILDVDLQTRLQTRYDKLEVNALANGYSLPLTKSQYVNVHVMAERTRIQSRAVQALRLVKRSRIPDELEFVRLESIAIDR
jgi:hypothetical protein